MHENNMAHNITKTVTLVVGVTLGASWGWAYIQHCVCTQSGSLKKSKYIVIGISVPSTILIMLLLSLNQYTNCMALICVLSLMIGMSWVLIFHGSSESRVIGPSTPIFYCWHFLIFLLDSDLTRGMVSASAFLVTFMQALHTYLEAAACPGW